MHNVKFRLVFEIDDQALADHQVEFQADSCKMTDDTEFDFADDRKKAMELIHCLECWKSERTVWHKVKREIKPFSQSTE
ncbi:hypothetical protein A4G19_13105 [Pasteurellaceae bacterium Macca]|nr:hypothetical protein [Pasteurellaceae bacterium Macca]MCK3656192.1 hypothetical protein [Pasteurellaceae bacterium Macca]MCK3656633.1 hypothetical protein [Pasteurellaceae bacterium Macca]